MTTEATKPKPVQVHRCGAVSASVWAREHNGQLFYSVTARRAFTRDDGKTFEYSDSFNRDDLATVSMLLAESLRTIMKLEAAAKERTRK